MTVWIWLSIVVCVATIAVLATIFLMRYKTLKKVNYMFDALEDGEINFHFREKNSLNRSLNRLRGIFERQRIVNEQESWTKLIRVLTHEIMNTLAPVVSLTDALSKEPDIRKNESLRESLDIISESSMNLIEFVNTYRQITGIAKPLRSRIDLKNLIDKTIRLNDRLLSEKKVEIKVKLPSEPVWVYADEIQIGQVIQNLIKNSWEAQATHIELQISHLSDGSVILKIKNDGYPIPADVQDQIFIPFYTTKSEGTGIGLSICRQIMRYHKGSIDLLRSNSSETVFELTFA